MNVTTKIKKKLYRGDTVEWTLKFKDKDIDINEFYTIKPKIIYTVGDDSSILNDISGVIEGKEHSFKLFNDNPFDGSNVVLNFLDGSITTNKRTWKYGDRVDVNKEIGDEIEYTIMKTGYAHKGSIENYVISSKYKDLPIIGDGIQFTDDDLVEKNINIIRLFDYDGGNMDSYQFWRNGVEITNDEITINGNTVSFACKLNDTVSFKFQRGEKSYNDEVTINETMYENGTTEKFFNFQSLNEDFVIKVNNKEISNITEIGYGYGSDSIIRLQFEKPSAKDNVSIKSNIDDVDFEGKDTMISNIWTISFTQNTTSKDKNYTLTFTANYYNAYMWSFVQKHAIEGTLKWTPKNLTYDSTNSLAETTIQITKATGTLTPQYEITRATWLCDITGVILYNLDRTNTFQSILNMNTGVLNVGSAVLAKGMYTITMKISGLSNKTYIKPSSFQPIEDSFTLIII